jgi:hypothetical protein
MEIVDKLLLAIKNDPCYAAGTKYLKYGFKSQQELIEGVRCLGIAGFVRSNTETQTQNGRISFGKPGDSLDVEITGPGKSYLKEHGLI